MNDFLAIIDATTYFPEARPLTDYRQIGAVPVLGDFRMIDFVLSSLVNSGCKSVGIFPSRSHRSLRDHISDGKAWNLNRRSDGLFLFPCTYLDLDQELFLSYKRIKDHVEYLNRSTQKYVVIGHTYGIFNIDFQKIIDEHVQTNADITVLKKDGRPIRFYVLSLELLKHLLDTFESHNENDIAHTILNRYELKILDFNIKEDFTLITNMQDYFQKSIGFIKDRQQIARLFLNNSKPIFSKTNNNAPAYYGCNSSVKNAIVANGCEIKGVVEESIIFKKVKIGENTKINNSLIFQGSIIGENCILENVIIDKEVIIHDNAVLQGTFDNPLYVHKRSEVS